MKVHEEDVVLRLQQVTKKAGKQVIVDQLSFDVRKGEIVGLLGPNGAGKTTTIRMIVGLIGMTGGDVLIKGHSIRSSFAKAISHVGAIVENPEFYPYMTGWDNLKQYQRMTIGITEERIKQVVEIVGLSEAMGKKVRSYSLGMRQRLGIAQALLHSPSILILDEPTNGLDPSGIREMRDYLKQIAQKEEIAILVSSHLLSEMEMMCSRVVVIQQGKFVHQQLIGAQQQGQEQTAANDIRIRVRELEKAEQVVRGLDGVQLVQLDTAASELEVSCNDEALALCVEELCRQQIGVYRIVEVKRSLEDEFLAWTGGSRIV
ncbi:ABC transporter ATP-binding protein [Paenibacillus montaniterrae]|uniref:ABC transporter ATP-binding protein n=1 Tax=Paenibacillus montaniterrae TaxID=429341 RepID=A0A919YU69_9BACL|nr:ABC transporter ATP-binding protein [Paenibacillus montaniterrae]GIP19525.1 ABC transporter ATP-binding protein [Paenibacillus montaniterrae]